MNMSDMLSAATVTTGAKISLMTFPSSRCLSNFSPILGITSPNTFLRIKNGDAAIYSQRSPILATNTSASARSGKKSAIAIPVLMINIHDVSQLLVTLVSESSAKFNNEEYIITKGPTNHLDLLMMLEIVVPTNKGSCLKSDPIDIPFVHQVSILTSSELIHQVSVFCHQL